MRPINDSGPLPVVAAFCGMLSIQIGAAFAKSLFPEVGAEGVAALRLGISAVLLTAVFRPWHLILGQRAYAPLLGYGVMLGLMNLLIYWAFAYLPIGIAISIEVLGPLGVALLSSRRRVDLLWIALSLGGLALLPLGAFHGTLDTRGIAFALTAALCWGLYVVFGSKVAAGGSRAVAAGMLIGAAFVVPLGIHHAGMRLVAWPVLGIGTAVALLSSTMPFLLDMYAMRRLPQRVFGVLLSASPAISAIAGWCILHETLTVMQCCGIAAITLACAGSALYSRHALAPPPNKAAMS